MLTGIRIRILQGIATPTAFPGCARRGDRSRTAPRNVPFFPTWPFGIAYGNIPTYGPEHGPRRGKGAPKDAPTV